MSHDATKNLNDVMRKYDRESNTRAWEGKPKIAVQAYLAAFASLARCSTRCGSHRSSAGC